VVVRSMLGDGVDERRSAQEILREESRLRLHESAQGLSVRKLKRAHATLR
jgi:hypothetical protein